MSRLTYSQRRYRDDEAFRLRKVNYGRARNGKPLVASVDEITRDYGVHARQRERGARGRFA